MKLDSDQVFCHGTIDHEPDPKPFECNDNVLDSVGLKSGEGFVKENQNGALCDLKCGEDGLRHGNKKDIGDAVASIPSTQMGSFEKDSVFYMDRNVMERDLPELIVCYKENAYDVVKDICIDEGVPSRDKFLFNTAIDEKTFCTLMPPEKDINGEMVQEGVDPYMHVADMLTSLGEKEKVDLHLPNPEMLKSSEELCSKSEFLPEFDFKDVLLTEEVKDDAPKNTAHDSIEEGFSLGHLLSMPELDAELSHQEFSNSSVDEVEQQSSQKPSENTVLPMVSASKKSENGNDGTILARPSLFSMAAKTDNGHEKAILGTSALDFAAEESDHVCDKSVRASCPLISAAEESDNGIKETKVANQALNLVPEGSTNKTGNEETGSVITFECDSSTARASGGEECPQSCEPEHLEKRNSCSRENTNTEPVSSQLQYSHGESSFSAAGPVSGLITYSGPIAYSGSLSIRSDSSTTSTRSFAFPVLQPEWNSSPVRMAKADGRHFRKQKCWRQGLFCCRF